MLDLLKGFLDWVALHPQWALTLLFVCCIGESIIVLGVLIPTSILLAAAGALVALDALQFWPVVLAATAGAVLGDSINFWIGRHYGERALLSPLAQRYCGAIERSREVFRRHGAKGLILGRFVGLLRPFISGFAGAYRMPVLLFLGVEAFAGMIWAIPHIVIGAAFGASLDLAAEVAGRLVVLIIALLLLIWLLIWLVGVAVNVVQDHAESWVHGLLDWSHRHRTVGRLGEWLADPKQPETPGLALLAVVLLAISALWLWLWWGLGAQHPAPFDALAYKTLKDLHTPGGLGLSVAIAQLGEWPVYVPVAAAVLAVLLALRGVRAAWHWVAAVGLAAVISLGLSQLALPDPLHYFRGEHLARFSGRELVLATVVYGFIAVLLATGRPQRTRTIYYATAVSLIALIAVAQMYVGAQWLSVALFAIVVGGVWVLLLAIGYRRHGAQVLNRGNFLLPVLGTFVVTAAYYWSTGFSGHLAAVTPVVRDYRQSVDSWWNGGYRALPPYRIDMAGVPKQPLNVQWLGALEEIEAALLQAGWLKTEPLEWDTTLRWLARLPIAELPVLPQVHNGRNQALMLRKPLDEEQQWALRLWPSEWLVDGAPLWIGSLTGQYSRDLLRSLRVPTMQKNFAEAMGALDPPPPGFTARAARHTELESSAQWNGAVWLLRPAMND
jgi:undecaprenyl-diphosphatase